MRLSPLLYVRQNFPDRSLSDVPAEVERQLAASGFEARLRPGSSVAVGVGSRGITGIDRIVAAVVRFWLARGMKPFIFPAMGSHGAATAEGQAAVLAHFGITEATMGCPVVSRLEVVSLGKTAGGIEAFMDQSAYDSDGVMLIGRVKWHTDFAGTLESGLFKMMAIGLGKFAGAKQYHTHAYNHGLEHVITSVGRQVLGSGKILGGLAILEDAYHQTAHLEAIPVERVEARERELLQLVKSWMPRVPCAIDVLIVDEMGKNFSGAGMDSKVINRGVNGEFNPWDTAPVIRRVYVRGLSEHSYGNAVGLGMADAIHSRMLPQIDWRPTRINALTASATAAMRTPADFGSDVEALATLWSTVGKFAVGEVRLGWIPNTLDLGTLAVTANVRDDLDGSAIDILSGPEDWPWSANGNLPLLKEALASVQTLNTR
ncbi:MAG TPA: hypothetical protein VES20_11055 [Bryobacteraceae bacterium]|nr:hypothetical protein [Bryobacteraceae bacterium]